MSSGSLGLSLGISANDFQKHGIPGHPQNPQNRVLKVLKVTPGAAFGPAAFRDRDFSRACPEPRVYPVGDPRPSALRSCGGHDIGEVVEVGEQAETGADLSTLGQMCPSVLMDVARGKAVLEVAGPDVFKDGLGGPQFGLV